MKPKFALLLAGLACMLGVMLTVVTGHVLSAVADYKASIFNMSASTFIINVVPDPAQDGPTLEEIAAINDTFRNDAGRAATIVLDARGGDGPRIGLYDPTGRYGGLAISDGRGFGLDDYESARPMALINQDSYLAQHEDLGIGRSMSVIGKYDPTSTPFDTDYLYNLFSQENLHGIYFVDSPDGRLAARFAALLQANGYLTDVRPLDVNAWSVLQADQLTLAYEMTLALVYASLVLLSVNYASANARRFYIHSLYGATPAVFTFRMMPLAAAASLVGTAFGICAALAILVSLGALSVLPDVGHSIALLVLNSSVVAALFGLAAAMKTSSMRLR